MPHFDRIGDNDLEEIASETGQWLTTTPMFVDKIIQGQQPSIAESMQVWSLSVDATTSLQMPFRESAINTQRWHHQIRFNQVTTAFARTKRERKSADSKAERWRIVRLCDSPLARQIDIAIEWIEANKLPEGTVRLLDIPAYDVDAFWLESKGGDYVILISAPDAYEALEKQRVYKKKEFLDQLSQLPFIQGVPAEAPPGTR